MIYLHNDCTMKYQTELKTLSALWTQFLQLIHRHSPIPLTHLSFIDTDHPKLQFLSSPANLDSPEHPQNAPPYFSPLRQNRPEKGGLIRCRLLLGLARCRFPAYCANSQGHFEFAGGSWIISTWRCERYRNEMEVDRRTWKKFEGEWKRRLFREKSEWKI